MRRLLLRALVASLLLSSVAAAQDPDPEAIAAALQLYQYRLLQAGTKLRGYPPEAVNARLEGSASVSLHISAAGALTRRAVIQSSGHRVLDEHALALLEEAVPLTEIPLALHNRAFIVRIVVAFVLPKEE
ncbi:MAG: TonB family protein [Betaproteobacteria bacterium]|nr:TonB family protein [Betaproteobacteria bacterium]